MKKITFLALLSFLTLSSIAQNKFGHINAQEILLLMPETKKAERELDAFSKSLEAQLGSLNAELEQSFQKYQANEATYTDLVKQDKEAEINGLQQRIQTFQQNAQQSYQNKEQELLTPINKKLQTAIKDVATEGNYTYIFADGVLHYKDDKNDVSALVKKKLGL